LIYNIYCFSPLSYTLVSVLSGEYHSSVHLYSRGHQTNERKRNRWWTFLFDKQVLYCTINKGNNKITELREILQSESKLISIKTDKISQQPENCENRNDPDLVQAFLKKMLDPYREHGQMKYIWNRHYFRTIVALNLLWSKCLKVISRSDTSNLLTTRRTKIE
jgi:hypothetical protein